MSLSVTQAPTAAALPTLTTRRRRSQVASAQLAALAPAATGATLVQQLPLAVGASASVRVGLGGSLLVPIAGAALGALLLGIPGAIIGGIAGWLIARRF